MKQIELLKKERKSYGGELLKTRQGRAHGRPLDTKNTIHLILRSSKAKGSWSFKRTENENKIKRIIQKFSQKYGVKIMSMANVGNHLHFQIKLTNRYNYFPFIRAITSAIAMSITGFSRWNKEARAEDRQKLKFWDYRPFTRVVNCFKAHLNLRDYIQINRIEGYGYKKNEARFIWQNFYLKPITYSQLGIT